MKILAIIPAYNEEGCIVETVDEFVELAPEYDYLVVNDGSSDGTERVCRERGFNHVTHPVNLGLTAGFQTGARYALMHGYDAAIQFDADGQHKPHYISTMVQEMEKSGADVVIGSRFVEQDKSLSARMLGSRLITGIISLTTRVHISDPTSGMRLYDRRALEIFATRYDFGPEPDSIAYLIRHGFQVVEVQVDMREREVGESYLGFGRSIMYMARTTVSMLFAQWFR